ncbi:formylglycine-generating enzyme family protein [Desulfurivibrio sp. D14AmB]|uniref:formylglycine-generating enzyme family protein n=1 Tax=Desulfurivibrio sp. D14AmB TaxID=3374370 RepID=UPI00376EC59A
MANLITIAGIDRALAALNLNPDTLKGRLALAIRSRFADETTLRQLTAIDGEELVRQVYDVTTPAEIKSKRKGLSSLKSALNKSLRELSGQENPEGVVIGKGNTFIISEERKDDLLREMELGGASPGDLRELFRGFKQLLAQVVREHGMEEIQDIVGELNAGRLLGGFGGATETGLPAEPLGSPPTFAEEGLAAVDGEEIEEVDEEELEEVDEELLEEIGEIGEPGGQEGAGELTPITEIALQEQEEIEEVAEEELEEIDEELLEEIFEVGEPGGLGESAGSAGPGPSPAGELAGRIIEHLMPRFIEIPGGTYSVGADRIPGASGNTAPRRQVTLPAFQLAETPVTNELFELFVRATGYESSAEKAGYGLVYEGRWVTTSDPDSGRAIITINQGVTSQQIPGACWRRPHGPDSNLAGRHRHPVLQVSYHDALAFAAWAGRRLPSEEEWEAAGRGPKGHPFPWGPEWGEKRGNFESSRLGDTAPAAEHGREAASPFGVLELLGNVYEWTTTPYQGAKATPAAIMVLKGGCWCSRGVITLGHREIERAATWSNIIGFRCAG